MMMTIGEVKKLTVTVAIVAIAAVLAGTTATAATVAPNRLELTEGWGLISSAKTNARGQELSAPGFWAEGMRPITVPATVLAGLVQNGEYEDFGYDLNLLKVPGSLPYPYDVATFPMPPFSPFRASWWYRVDFTPPADWAGKELWLYLEGVNYRANVFINGKKIADAGEIVGTYRVFELNVTGQVTPGEANALALEIFPPHKRDLAVTWVDWNPAPPDRDMGIFRGVRLSASGPVAARYPHVVSRVAPALDQAALTVVADLVNGTDREVSGVARIELLGVALEQEVTVAPGATAEVVFGPETFPELVVAHPKLWWPWHYGEQNLHDLTVSFSADGRLSDRTSARFGIREVTDEFTDQGARVISVNGRRVLIRGAGWAADMLFRHDPARLDAELAYVRDLNLNALRLEGQHEVQPFYDRCDELGIMVITGWCCCHHWERWSTWDTEDYRVARASERDQTKRIRHHPSVVIWMNGSDRPPPAPVERTYLEVLERVRWPGAVISSATEADAQYSGPSGVKMNGPYEYVPPVYWYKDDKFGGAWNFNTETSPGPAVPPIESLRSMLPEDKLWPINRHWNYHAGRGAFANIDVFKKAQDQRYGPSGGVEEFALKAQAMTYELQRAMMEAFGREKYRATGVIQWMLNDAWPKIIWHLYDYYLRPGGGYFGTKKACEPLHVQYSYDDRSVVVVNSRLQAEDGLAVKAALYNLDASEVWRDEAAAAVGPDEAVRVMSVPEPAGLSRTYFLRLELLRQGQLVSKNFYWLSTQMDELNWIATQWHYTPTRTYADFTALNELAPARLEASLAAGAGQGHATVTVKNASDVLAFLVRLKITAGQGGDEVLPVIWEDNYFELLPGETRTVAAEYRPADLGPARPALEASAWNAETVVVK